jgi:uncharacterized protein (TIGR02757 family)
VTLKELKALLESEAAKRNDSAELSLQKPDPLMVASRYRHETIALICALFAYGNAHHIVRFLDTLDFSLLEQSEAAIQTSLHAHYYRFQSPADVQALFISLKRLRDKHGSIESLFMQGYANKRSTMNGLARILSVLYEINPYRSRGYQFLLGTIPSSNPVSPYKRWLMYFRWMVRCDALDLGLWKDVDTKDLLMPLDTHTFRLGKKLGLIKRQTYDFKAVLECTEALKKLDPTDPIKFDFALYRLGQEKLLP